MNKDIVRKLYEDYINNRKIEELGEIIAADYEDVASGQTGLNIYQVFVMNVTTGFPDVKFEIKDLLEDGNKVAVRWQWRGTHNGSFNGLYATGKKAMANGTTIFEIKDGLLIKGFTLVDRLNPLQDMGLIPRDLTTLNK